MEFAGKVALITGASVGIGRAAALLLAERGAALILLDIDQEKLLLVGKELEPLGRRVQLLECDVSNEEQVNAALAGVGKVDILVNNAAVWRDSLPFTEASTDLWCRYLDINVMGPVYCTKAVLPGMLERGYGRVINIASVAGVYGNRRMVHYSASKGALIAMTKALAKEVAEQGVTVNSISPGSVSSSKNEDIDAFTPTELSYTGRTGTDRENAELICFLASDRAGYINGENILIDGCRRKL